MLGMQSFLNLMYQYIDGTGLNINHYPTYSTYPKRCLGKWFSEPTYLIRLQVNLNLFIVSERYFIQADVINNYVQGLWNNV